MMRRVKKTTNEQFDLLKAEMAVNPAAARGYGVGANRAIVDAEWKSIVEKLNALGPPQRTMTEWKKVWSDTRLRNKKRFMQKYANKLKRTESEPKEDVLMEALNSSISIYNSHNKKHLSNNQVPEITNTLPASTNIDLYKNDINDKEEYYNNNCNYNTDYEQIIHETIPPLYYNVKFVDVEQTLRTIQHQLEEQNKLVDHLVQVSTNMAFLMERQIHALEEKTSVMERLSKAKEFHNVWSDLRLRNIKRLSEEFTPKPKKVKYKCKKNRLLETLNNSDSIYASYGESAAEKPCSTFLDPIGESHHNAEESYDNDPIKEEELAGSKEHFFNSSIHSLEENDELYPNNSSNYRLDCQSPPDAIHSNFSDEKFNYLGQTLTTIELQIKNQNKMIEHLSKITSNLTKLVERHVTNLEKQNKIVERQLRATECHNMFLRRQEARRKIQTKCKSLEFQKL